MPLNKLAYSMAKRDSAFTNRGVVSKKNDASVAQVPQRDARVAELVDAPGFRFRPSGVKVRLLSRMPSS